MEKMSSDEEENLTEADAMPVFLEITAAQNRAFQLGLLFNLLPHEAEGICSEHAQARDKLLYILIASLRKAPLTWRVIADALRTKAVDLPRLAGEIEEKHCPRRKSRFPPVEDRGLVAASRDYTAAEEKRDVHTVPKEKGRRKMSTKSAHLQKKKKNRNSWLEQSLDSQQGLHQYAQQQQPPPQLVYTPYGWQSISPPISPPPPIIPQATSKWQEGSLQSFVHITRMPLNQPQHPSTATTHFANIQAHHNVLHHNRGH